MDVIVQESAVGLVEYSPLWPDVRNAYWRAITSQRYR